MHQTAKYWTKSKDSNTILVPFLNETWTFRFPNAIEKQTASGHTEKQNASDLQGCFKIFLHCSP